MLFIYANDDVLAQTHESAFGKIYSIPLGAGYNKGIMITGNRKEKLSLAVFSEHRKEVLFAGFDSALTSAKCILKQTLLGFDDLYIADFDGNRKNDLLLVNKHDKLLSIILDLATDSLYVSNAVKLTIEPENVFIVDYNNDKRMDILVYTRKIPGILPLIGKGKGRFMAGDLIAPDNLIGAADFAQVNNDNLVDLIVWDWVKNEIHVLYGVGKGRFTDQSIFPVTGEVSQLVMEPIYRKHSLDIILKMTKPSQLQIWEGNGFGDFQMKNQIQFEGDITDFDLADVNNDGLNDIIAVLDPPALQVVFNNDANTFTDRVEYDCGNDPRKIIIPSRRKNETQDCIVLDREGKQLITFKNIMGSDLMADSVKLATGIFPTNLVANDLNRDGIEDIALLNKRSKSLSLYFGQKLTNPFGPYSYSLINEPDQLAFHSSTDTSLQMVITFSGSNQISYFTLDAANNSVSNAFIGGEENVQFLGTTINEKRQAGFIVINSTVSKGKYFSFYKQIGPVTFIERNFRLLPPTYLLGACVADINYDRYPDIIYAYRTADSLNTELGIAFGDPDYSMKKRFVTKKLFLSVYSHVFLWSADFDNDGLTDLLLQSDPKKDCLMIARGRGKGLFSDFNELPCGIPIEKRNLVQIIDVDKDNLSDIVIGSRKHGQIVWLHNRGDLKFDSSRTIIAERDLYHYIITDADADGINDIAITCGKKGFLKIVNGRLLPFNIEASAK